MSVIGRMALACVVTIASIGNVWSNTNEYDVRLVEKLDLDRGIVDLRDINNMGSPERYRVKIDGDSVHVWSPKMRCDFRVIGDTINQTGCETRAYYVKYDPYIVKNGLHSGEYKLNGRLRQSEFISGKGFSTTSKPTSITLITQEGDTITRALLYKNCWQSQWYVVKDSINIRSGCTTVSTAYVMIAGEEFPRVCSQRIKTEYTNSETRQDSIAWIRQSIASELVKTKTRINIYKQLISQQETKPLSEIRGFGDNQNVVVEIVGNDLKIKFSDLDDADVWISVSDMLGRLYIDRQSHVVGEEIIIDIGSLPRGDFSLNMTIRGIERPMAVKFFKP